MNILARRKTWVVVVMIGLWIVLALVSCTPLAPFRTQQNPSANCTPQNTHGDPTASTFASVNGACSTLVEEVAPASPDGSGYELHFVEFDDQGQPYGNSPSSVSQMDDFLAHVRSANAADNDEGRTSVIVFVHGWKHNAESNDGNVRWFRAMLDRISTIESISNCSRHVIGLYVGWQGDSTSLPDVAKDTTFWTRKAAATRVADGQIRELFGRLRAIQDIHNEYWKAVVNTSVHSPEATDSSKAEISCTKQMRLTIVGHSFGGLIVYNALGPSLIHDIGELNERILHTPNRSADPYLEREGDLIVTINPAVEAAAFVPLWQAAHHMTARSYHGPLFVSITSDNDDATGMAFPAARFFDTMFDRYVGGTHERAAARETIGHDNDVIDYRLNEISVLNKTDPSLHLEADADCEQIAGISDFTARYNAESQRLDALGEALRQTRDANKLSKDFFPRQFCVQKTSDGNVALALVPKNGVNLNTPVWNVETARPVLDDHSDLLNPLLIDVLRQLYEEGTRPETQRILFRAKPTPAPPAPKS